MVGLTELGDYADDAERVMNRLIDEERPVTPAVLAMIAVAETSFRGWVEALTRERRVVADPRALRAGSRRSNVSCRAAPPSRGCGQLGRGWRSRTGAGACAAVECHRVATFPRGRGGAVVPSGHTAELIELPELVSTRASPNQCRRAPVAELIELVDVPLPNAAEPIALRLVDATGPVAEPDLPAMEFPLAEAPEEDVTIGDVTLSRSLWNILCDEADQHLATLEHERSVLQFDRTRCRRRRWCARATRCAASTVPAAFRWWPPRPSPSSRR